MNLLGLLAVLFIIVGAIITIFAAIHLSIAGLVFGIILLIVGLWLRGNGDRVL